MWSTSSQFPQYRKKEFLECHKEAVEKTKKFVSSFNNFPIHFEISLETVGMGYAIYNCKIK